MTQIAHILGYQLARHQADFEFCKSLIHMGRYALLIFINVLSVFFYFLESKQ